MGDINLTVTALVALCALILYVAAHGATWAIIHPFPLICVSYVQFFGRYVDDQAVRREVDLMNLLAFLTFSAAFFLVERAIRFRSAQRMIDIIWRTKIRIRPPALTLTRQALLVLVPLCFILAYTVINADIYGGLEASLVRFYAGMAERPMSPWLTRIQIPWYSISLLCLAVLRMNLQYGRTQGGRLMFWLAAAVLMIGMVPTGTAGYILAVPIILLVADCTVSLRRRGSLRVRFDIVLCVFVSVVLGAVMLVVRQTTYTSVSDLTDRLVADGLTLDSGANAISGSSAIVAEKVGECLDRFGPGSYMWFYTPYSILVNPLPREWWPNKPIGFGRILALPPGTDPVTATAFNRGGAEVSFAAGLAGEGYANGGYFGIIFLSSLFGALCGWSSRVAMVGLRSPSYVHNSIGFLLRTVPGFFVRGDMLSAWGATIYPAVVFCALLYAVSACRKDGSSVRVQRRLFTVGPRQSVTQSANFS